MGETVVIETDDTGSGWQAGLAAAMTAHQAVHDAHGATHEAHRAEHMAHDALHREPAEVPAAPPAIIVLEPPPVIEPVAEPPVIEPPAPEPVPVVEPDVSGWLTW